MIRLGHIDYSNCVPVHALLLDEPQPGIELVSGVPSALNRALAEGSIDAAPCSSIEFARHAGSYRILPGPAIGSLGAVQSILLETTAPPERLHGMKVAVPTASATSVVLLRILLELQYGVHPELVWYEQTDGADPIDDGAAAALRIGDIALRRTPPAGRDTLDLGAAWHDWTGLPFAFAVWQVRRELDAAGARALADAIAASRAYFSANAQRLASAHAPRFGLEPQRLLEYWASLRFDFDPAMQAGLLRFYDLAARLGEAPATDTLHFVALDNA
jgi:chorismate dehydratase